MSKARDLADFISDSTIETAEIADGAVTAGKLNVTGNGTLGQALTSDADGSFSWTTITSDLVDDASPQLGGDLDTNGNDITFGDNDKAIFGDGSDLQIYHDGTRSFIQDVNDGNLILDTFNGNEVNITSGGNAEFMIRAIKDGAVNLYYDNSTYSDPKLATTSTGIDVTGTVVADGLTVDGLTTASKANDSKQLKLERTGSSTGSSFLGSDSSAAMHIFDSGSNPVATFYQNQDVAFYEDTGTTPKLFWDASAESLGIGTSSPQAKLNINTAAEASVPALGSDTSFLMIGNDGSGTTNYGTMFGTLSNGSGYIQQQRFDGTATAYNLALQPNGGNVGIGTTSPDASLDLGSKTDAVVLPKGTTAQRPGSPVEGMTRYNIDNDKVEVYADGFWQIVGDQASPVIASGGTETTVGSYTVNTFTSSGSFIVTQSGIVDILCVAGGGGGGAAGGGGGAGGVVVATDVRVTPQTYTVTVGGGGSGAAGSGQEGSNGQDSSIGTLVTTAIGGGGGGGGVGGADPNGPGDGGSGGGAGRDTSNSGGGSGTSGQGFDGGNVLGTGATGGGGGGGAGEAGTNDVNGSGNGATDSGIAPDGGDGIENDYRTGSDVYYGGGGGGAMWGTQSASAGAGGQGGGGAGAKSSSNANGSNGTDGLGGGGGGSAGGNTDGGTAGNGGSGIVVIRYLTNG